MFLLLLVEGMRVRGEVRVRRHIVSLSFRWNRLVLCLGILCLLLYVCDIVRPSQNAHQSYNPPDK